MQAERLKSAELERKGGAAGAGKRPAAAAATGSKVDAATLQDKLAGLQREVERVKQSCDEQLLTKDGTHFIVFVVWLSWILLIGVRSIQRSCGYVATC